MSNYWLDVANIASDLQHREWNPIILEIMPVPNYQELNLDDTLHLADMAICFRNTLQDASADADDVPFSKEMVVAMEQRLREIVVKLTR
ncbi:MAG: hypothetical protein KGZ39_05750 [Simkania sp.]|nr:hypothetical protein [Simkania sp.]